MLLHEELQKMRLFYLAENLDQFISQSSKSNLAPKQLIQRIVELETIERQNRSTQNRLKAARIGKTKFMHDFDWSWPKEISRPIVDELMNGDFVRNNQNAVIAGPQGVGKTMIAKNIALTAISQGFNVLFTTASDLVIDLGAQESSAALQRRLKRYVRPNLLVIDELGYLSFDHRAADLLFEIVTKRYESGSIIITTNLAFKDWGNPFQGAGSVTPLIDRLTHHCEIIKIDGDSFRTKESTSNKKEKRNARQPSQH